MPDDKNLAQLHRLLTIMAQLRGPDGCPWDAAQTPESLKPYLIEEAYEVLEAIEQNEPEALCEELGDLLLQIVFHARIYEERGTFDIGDVAATIADKLERRHPQIFANAPRLDPDEHHRQWDRIKRAERQARGVPHGPFDGIPAALPALQRARKVLAKSAQAGYPHPLAELSTETWLEQMTTTLTLFAAGSSLTQEEILGDLLLAIVAKSNATIPDPEQALRLATERFMARHPSEQTR